MHLEGSQILEYTDENGIVQHIDSGLAGRTTLTEFFRICRDNIPIPKTSLTTRDLLYQDVPKYFRWDKNRNMFILRTNNTPSVPRLYFASLKDGERYYLRMLLTHVRGPTCYADLKMAYGQRFETYREAAQARGLLLNDKHYDDALTESALWKTGHELRHFFALILVHSRPSDPATLWNAHKHNIGDDCRYWLMRNARTETFNEEEIHIVCSV